MDLSQPAHGDAYANIYRFRRAAFAGLSYASWVRATSEAAQRNARFTYLQLRANEAPEFVRAAEAAAVPLEHLGILVSIQRQELDERGVASALGTPHVAGIDVVGAETIAQDPQVLTRALELLRSAGRPTVLRVHAGEGYLGEGGHDNVNRVLATLADRAEAVDLSPVKVILAHAARIGDLAAARRDLERLAARGVRVEINVNPLSNLVYHAAEPRDIAALALPGPKVAGSDNIGSLADNLAVVEALARGDLRTVERKTRHLRRLAERWRATQSEAPDRPLPSQ
jgi:hypothetical protein